MWRARTLLLLGLATLGALVLFVALLAAPASAQPSNSPSSSCQVQYHPVASCSVPSGGTLDPCSLVSAGTLHCAFTLPDFNPGDWLGWLGCSIAAEAGTIWNAIQSYVATFLVNTVQALFNLVLSPVAQVENALANAIVGAIDWFGTTVAGAFSGLNTAVAPLGPLAPIVVVAVTLGIFLLAGIGLYLVTIFLWAIFKTAFNLL